MAHHSNSGRIVVQVDQDLKRQLYAALSLSGMTLKEWFRASAAAYCNGPTDGGGPQSLSKAGARSSAGDSVRLLPRRSSRAAGRGASSAGSKRYSVVSMFSGCGGMDLGFRGGFSVFGRRYAPRPFDIVWANDLNQEACKTYRRNLGGEILAGDVWGLFDKLPNYADVIVGGFPCQDISVNGKRAGVNGARSGLYKAMVRAVDKIKPRVFVAENVKALLRNSEWLAQVLGDFESLGYNLHYQLYQAADYGVPQTRERVLIVGTARGLPRFEPPLPERDASSWMTAREALADLESADQDHDSNHIWSLANASPHQGSRRLIAERPGYTIRAECHGNIQYHYVLPRRISMREAARIQSFPDDFKFVSGLRETERQVGNAVPPVLAWHVAGSVLACLRSRVGK